MATTASLDNIFFYHGPPSQSTVRKPPERSPAVRGCPSQVVFSIPSPREPPVDYTGAGIDTGSLKPRIVSTIAPSHRQELSPSQLSSGASGHIVPEETTQTPDAACSTVGASAPGSVGSSRAHSAESVAAACSPPLQIEFTAPLSSAADLQASTERSRGANITSAGPGSRSCTEDMESVLVAETGNTSGLTSDGGVAARELSTGQPSARTTSWPSPPSCVDAHRHSVGLSPSTWIPLANSDGSDGDVSWRPQPYVADLSRQAASLYKASSRCLQSGPDNNVRSAESVEADDAPRGEIARPGLQKSSASGTHFRSRYLPKATSDDIESEAPRKPYQRVRTKLSSHSSSNSALRPSRRGPSTRPETAIRPSRPTWAVNRIVGSRRRGSKLYYRVRWQDTWEPAKCLQGSADTAIQEYEDATKWKSTCSQ
ncbi:hypothetical protein LTR78_010474 [Recurvomyces mirabilis]|uniref:Chromo domain-containing protein n=1 Tax=Recurvomyces mirabilis TaxID=574656 RepID=A0AAE0TQ10_9PEZI|nr:hypothetical protein LTR78_010474 [Recurvomyces mirabilis]KAK5150367.1 hypothetical protein LTS14_010206 [Recurvomyces mirabilis]